MVVCPRCFRTLESTGSGPEWMNSEQWDAAKAGDYFTEFCGNESNNIAACFGIKSIRNGNYYFWEDSIEKENA